MIPSDRRCRRTDRQFRRLSARLGRQRTNNPVQEEPMATERFLADILQELYDAKKTGALYVRIVETSEDLYRIFFRNGDICHIRYGSAVGRDCIDILEYYNLAGATYFDGINAPEGASYSLPGTQEIIATMRSFNKKVNIR
jgi:hypothetical protein